MNRTIRYVTILICTLIGGLTASARYTVVDAFKRASVPAMPLLTESTRLDMVDYFRAGKEEHTEQNALGGASRITRLDTDYMTLQLGESERIDMFLLPTASDTIIGVIQTLNTPTPDSSLKLYNRNWERLRGLEEPTLADWLSAAGKKQRQAVEQTVGFVLASYAYNPETHRLTLTNHSTEWLDKEAAATITPLMLTEITYEWNRHGFKRINN